MNLQVVVPEAFILGSGELHVDMGSTINLVCIIEKVSLALSAPLQAICIQSATLRMRNISHLFLPLLLFLEPHTTAVRVLAEERSADQLLRLEAGHLD